MSSTQPAQSGFAEVNGARLYYEVAGQGHPLVLTHEGIGDSRMYDDQMGAFTQHFHTIRYDMRGFGQSSVPTAPFSLSEDLYALLRLLGVERAHVLGMSIGGGASIDFALMHPDMVSALVLAGSALGGFDFAGDPSEEQFEAAARAQDFARLTDLAEQVWVVGQGRTADEVSPAVRERVREMMAHNFSLGTDEGLAQPLDPPAIGRLGEIHVPTLVIVGDRDIPDEQRVADALAAGISGARKVVMRDTAHVPNMEQPAEFNRLVLDFLAGVPTG
jgi:pimeloyl-ACP methyl ester carboxylesterase